MTPSEDLESTAQRARIVDAEFGIHAVLDARSLLSHFQPIISIREKKVIGLEALVRATNPKSGKPISPNFLFDAASRHKQSLQLDSFCRENAISVFATLASLDPDLILFINVDVSSLGRSAAESNALIKLTEEYRSEERRVGKECRS